MTVSASDILIAAETLDRIHKQNSGLIKTAEALRELGALEGRFAEVKRGLAESQGLLDGEHKKLAEARTALGEATEARAIIIKNAQDEAARIVGDANQYAAQAKKQSETVAADAIAAGKEHAARIEEDAGRIKAQAETLGREAKAELSGVQRDIAEKKKELQGLEDRVSRAKSEASRIAAGG